METNGYRAVYEGGQGEIIEKKSRFIATVLPIETEEEALEFIAKMTQLLCLCHWRASGATKMFR